MNTVAEDIALIDKEINFLAVEIAKCKNIYSVIYTEETINIATMQYFLERSNEINRSATLNDIRINVGYTEDTNRYGDTLESHGVELSIDFTDYNRIGVLNNNISKLNKQRLLLVDAEAREEKRKNLIIEEARQAKLDHKEARRKARLAAHDEAFAKSEEYLINKYC